MKTSRLLPHCVILLALVKGFSNGLDPQETTSYPKLMARKLNATSTLQDAKSMKRGLREVRNMRENPKDLGIRFSKVVFPEGTVTNVSLPLTSEDYPITVAFANELRKSLCHSVITTDDYECRGLDVEELLVKIDGPYPVYPSSDPKSLYWDDLREVVELQHVRRACRGDCQASDYMVLPAVWSGYSLDEVAEVVHTDFPGTLSVPLLQSFLKEGLALDKNVIPFQSTVNFLHGPVMLAELNTWAVGTVGPRAFAVKYYVGQVRPEEMAWKIVTRELRHKDGVPRDILKKVRRLHLEHMTNFTAYPEGCPIHPSFPAMHAAATSLSLWLAVVSNLTEAQWCQTKLLDHAVAYGRTIAGVHYRADNLVGLKIGQELVAEDLPQFLNKRYGSDVNVVKAKIEKVRFNWSTFDPASCTV